MNTFACVGNLCSDVELKQTSTGLSVCRCNVAIRRPFSKDKTDFIPMVAWNNTAEFLAQYGKKGRKVAISGYLMTDSYEKDGRKIFTYNINISEVEFCDPRPSQDPAAAPAAAPPSYESDAASQVMFEELQNDSQLPF